MVKKLVKQEEMRSITKQQEKIKALTKKVNELNEIRDNDAREKSITYERFFG